MKRKLLQRIRIPLGTVTAGLFFLAARPTLPWLLAGAVPLLLGQAIRLWSAGHIRKNRELTCSGPYQFTRNPLYLGSTLMGLGFGLQSGIYWLAPAFLPLFLLVYIPVMKHEERDLSEFFGDAYSRYRAAVPFFLPSPGRRVHCDVSFSWAQVVKNREYNAPLGLVGAECILLIKMAFPALSLFR